MDVCYIAGNVMLIQAKVVKDEQEARKMLEKCIRDGSTFTKFLEFVQAKDGDVDYVPISEKYHSNLG